MEILIGKVGRDVMGERIMMNSQNLDSDSLEKVVKM